MDISVVIPCFNDESKLQYIVNEIHKSPRVKEIIVVDDGSLQKTKAVLANIKGITLITHPFNRGKAKALLTGLNMVSGELVLFVDSDLTNFSKKHIDVMYDKMCRGKFDLVLGFREKEISYMKWIGFAQAYTGERMIRRSVLLKHKDVFSVDNYLIEPAINLIFFHHYKVGGVILKNLGQTYKFQKKGMAGLIGDFRMYLSYLNYLGFKELIFQLKFALALQP